MELKQKFEENQAIARDENAFPSNREATEVIVAEVNKELSQLQTQVEEREAAMPPRERIHKIFKEYGVTVALIFLAARITIGAVVGAINKAMKTLGKNLRNGLKAIGSQAASVLPGLIGSIISFPFETAGQAIGYLAEHTWLLILVGVVFIFEKYIKRRG